MRGFLLGVHVRLESRHSDLAFREGKHVVARNTFVDDQKIDVAANRLSSGRKRSEDDDFDERYPAGETVEALSQSLEDFLTSMARVKDSRRT